MGIVVSRGDCPPNDGSCPIGVIVLRGIRPEGVVFLMVSCPRGSYPRW